MSPVAKAAYGGLFGPKTVNPLNKRNAHNYGVEVAPNVRAATLRGAIFSTYVEDPASTHMRGDGTARCFGVEFIDPERFTPDSIHAAIAEAIERA